MGFKRDSSIVLPLDNMSTIDLSYLYKADISSSCAAGKDIVDRLAFATQYSFFSNRLNTIKPTIRYIQDITVFTET